MHSTVQGRQPTRFLLCAQQVKYRGDQGKKSVIKDLFGEIRRYDLHTCALWGIPHNNCIAVLSSTHRLSLTFLCLENFKMPPSKWTNEHT